MKPALPGDYDYYHVHVDSAYGLHFADRVISGFNFKTVLDFGCGPGHSVRKFISAGKTVIGVDISPAALARCPTHCCFRIQPNQSLPFQDRSFDLVFSADVLEHLHEAEAVLAIRELERVTNRFLVASICFRPSESLPEFQWHATVKPRTWWESHFTLDKLAGWESEHEPNLFVYKRVIAPAMIS